MSPGPTARRPRRRRGRGRRRRPSRARRRWAGRARSRARSGPRARSARARAALSSSLRPGPSSATISWCVVVALTIVTDDARALRRHLDRVVDEVVEDLLDAAWDRPGRRRVRRARRGPAGPRWRRRPPTTCPRGRRRGRRGRPSPAPPTPRRARAAGGRPTSAAEPVRLVDGGAQVVLILGGRPAALCRFSSRSRSAVSGVRSWWEASATNSRCSARSWSRRRAIVFMVSPRTAISGGAEGSGSPAPRSPVAKRAAAASQRAERPGDGAGDRPADAGHSDQHHHGDGDQAQPVAVDERVGHLACRA